MITRKEAINMVIENNYTDGKEIFKCIYCDSNDIRDYIVDYTVDPHEVLVYKCNKCGRLSDLCDFKYL